MLRRDIYSCTIYSIVLGLVINAGKLFQVRHSLVFSQIVESPSLHIRSFIAVVTAVQCPSPENPKNGKAIYTSFSYNSVVSYECKYGYTLVGESSRRCGADRKWSGSLPACKEINCGHPGSLYNGWLENIEAGTGLGASIIYRCHPGMLLIGNTSTVCQIEGRWRYPVPECLGKYFWYNDEQTAYYECHSQGSFK